MKTEITRTLTVCTAAILLTGCAATRGVDFGHWARTGEKIKAISITVAEKQKLLTGKENILLLPPKGDMPGKNLKDLQEILYQQMRNYLPATVFTTKSKSIKKKYLDDSNFYQAGDQINIDETGRLGNLMGASHVIATHVREFRAYLPQKLALNIIVIDTATRKKIAVLDATFDASEQQVVLAASDYMQRRQARKYDSQNLDIMLRSPKEFGTFVCAESSYALRQRLWLKNFFH